MSATSASRNISLSDITKCSICLETWIDPRSLPVCDHIFCLQCLKTFVQKLDEDGEDTRCPVCRKEFTIPEGGLDVLPKKFIHQQLLDARRGDGVKAASICEAKIQMCELCPFNIAASGFCVDCDQNVCTPCAMIHSRARGTRHHTVVELGDKKNPKLIRKLHSSYCQQHQEERVKLYCEDCQKLLCTICHATQHVGHKCAAINDAAQVFVDRVKECHVSMEDRIAKTGGYLAQLDKDRNEFLEIISDKEKKLEEKEEEMIKLIKAEHAQLRKELKQIKEQRLKKIIVKKEEIKIELLALKGFMKTSEELLDNGSVSDICRSTNDLLAQAEALVKSQTESTPNYILDRIEISFVPSMKPDVNGCEVRLIGLIHYTSIIDVNEENSSSQNQKAITLDHLFTSLETQVKEKDTKISNLEKQVKEKDTKISSLETQSEQVEEECRNEAIDPERSTLFLSKSTIVRVIPGADKGRVYGIEVLGSQLFITRKGGTSVDVYDTNNMTATPRLLKISDDTLSCPRLAACSHYNCLYVSHWRTNTASVVMYRVELSNSSVSSWGVTWGGVGTLRCFSLTSNYTILYILVHGKVREYTTLGELIREISLDRTIDDPYHCIQLSDGNFVVSHSGSQHRVCIVDASGCILKSYGESRGSAVEQLNYPHQLSVHKYNQVFVCDRGNNRVQLLSPALTLLGTVQIPGHQLNCPDTLHFDKINHRLYVNKCSDVLVVELSNAQK